MEKLNGVSSVVLEGSFIKSPPQSKLENRSSWHERYFALVRLTCHVNKIHSPTRKGPKKLEGLKDFYLVYWEKKSDRKNGRRPISKFCLDKSDILCAIFASTPDLGQQAGDEVNLKFYF